MSYTRLYVGDLSKQTTKEQLQKLFAQDGDVVDIRFAPPSSFAFVEMGSPTEAQQAVERYNGYDLNGLHLIVYGVPQRSHPRLEQA